MLERMKQAVVDSYVGAIALGYLLAKVILHFANIFGTPIGVWATQKQYGSIMQHTTTVGFPFEEALPEAVRFVLSLALWYLLLWWLYMKPARRENSELSPEAR